MLRLFDVLCRRGIANYVYECGVLVWIEKAMHFRDPDIQESMYSCLVALIQEWNGTFSSDDLYKRGWIKEALNLFNADCTPIRVKTAIMMFVAVMFNRASPELTIHLHQEGVFKLLVEHFVMLDFDEFYTIVTRGTEILRRRSAKDAEEALDFVCCNTDLLEWIRDEEYAGNEEAKLLSYRLGSIINDRDDEL